MPYANDISMPNTSERGKERFAFEIITFCLTAENVVMVTGIAHWHKEKYYIQVFLFDNVCLMFKKHNVQVVTGGWDKVACIWDASTGQLLNQMGGHDQVNKVEVEISHKSGESRR